MSFIALFENDIAIKLEMEDHLFNHVISLEQAIFVRELR